MTERICACGLSVTIKEGEEEAGGGARIRSHLGSNHQRLKEIIFNVHRKMAGPSQLSVPVASVLRCGGTLSRSAPWGSAAASLAATALAP